MLHLTLKRMLCVGVVVWATGCGSGVVASAQAQEKAAAPSAGDTEPDGTGGVESPDQETNGFPAGGDYPPASPRKPQTPEGDRPEADETIETAGLVIGAVALLIAVVCTIGNRVRKRSANAGSE